VSIEDKIATLEDLVSKMVYVKYGNYVLAVHTNTFVDYCVTAVDLLSEIYEAFKAKTGKTLLDVEYWIEMAKGRVGFMRKVKFGDLVETKDHNLVVDTLKPIEVALRMIEANL
jgi:hypothetical protein